MTDRSWPIEKLGRTARIGNGSTPRRDSTIYWDSGDVPWLNSSVVNKSRVTQAEQFVTAVALRECHLPVVAPGSVLVGLTGQGKTRGMATILDIEATLNQHIAYVTPDPSRWFPEYLLWSLRSAYDELRCVSEENGSTKGGLTCEALKQFRLVVPPFGYQRVIANYLDRETARIDTLIEEQQRLIELLHERRESAIRAVLLRGLDSDAPLRASGSEFLGSIPSVWNVVPTRHLCTITTGDEDSGNATEDGAYPFYVRGREILRSNAYAFDGEAVMTPGDGQGGTGKVFHYFDGKFQAHQRVYVFTDFHRIAGRYFYYYLSTFLRPIALAGSNTVTMESLRRPLLAGFPVAVPPSEEQIRIVGYLDEQTAKIDQLIAETERFIELSQERRAALITAAVTGQIDVRGAA
ncbi:restriction endonuclease subunit S [Streptomyces decoyicus]|uniref:restriction endonuclease subunit S n=1 Tax=Streptomyces decoyicus TaxID=249567 RepID=UPI00386FC075